MTHGSDRSAGTDETPPTSVANPRRIRVGADGRPEPAPVPEPADWS